MTYIFSKIDAKAWTLSLNCFAEMTSGGVKLMIFACSPSGRKMKPRCRRVLIVCKGKTLIQQFTDMLGNSGSVHANKVIFKCEIRSAGNDRAFAILFDFFSIFFDKLSDFIDNCSLE